MKHDKGGPIVDWNRKLMQASRKDLMELMDEIASSDDRPAHVRKLMPALEAASMSYDRRRALRRAAIYDAWVNAGHYSKDIQPLNDVALIEIALDAIENIDHNSSDGTPTS